DGKKKRPLPSKKRFSIPLLEDPASLVDFVLDRAPVDLFYYDLPDLDLLFEYQKSFQVFPGLNAGFSGEINVTTNFDFGFDTRGLSQWRDEDFDPSQVHLIFNGFYLDDHGEENTADDAPEITLRAAIGAVASLGIGGLIEAGVEGGIEATIDLDLNDKLTVFTADDLAIGDGKFYGNELISRISQGPECLFDIHGQLTIFLEAFFWVGLDLGFSRVTIFEAGERFVDAIIAEFDFECSLDSPDSIATLSGEPSSDKVVTTTGNASRVLTLKYEGGESDGPQNYKVEVAVADDSFTLQHAVDKGYIDLDYYTSPELNSISAELAAARSSHPGQEFIVVTNNAKAEFFLASQVNSIVAAGTEHSDSFVLRGLNGRIDHIDLSSGDSGDMIEVLSDLETAATLVSLDIDSGGGDDFIRVDPKLFGVEAPETYTIASGAGLDRIKLQQDVNDDPSKPAAVQYIYTGVFLDGGPGDDVIMGHTGKETVKGGSGADVIMTYAGDDEVHGEAGDDFIATGKGADMVWAGLGNDRVLGGSDADVLRGGDGDDVLMGEDGADVLYGDANDDLLVGGLDADQLFGGTHDDTATWELGDGSDTFEGGTGTDQLSMTGYVLNPQAFYTDPANYVIDDEDAVDLVTIRAHDSDTDTALNKQAYIDWTHKPTLPLNHEDPTPEVRFTFGAVETLKLDAGLGTDDILVGALDATSVDSVRVAAGAGRTIVEESHVTRDENGVSVGQDLTVTGAVDENLQIRVGNYGGSTAAIRLEGTSGQVDFGLTALAIESGLRELLGIDTVSVGVDVTRNEYEFDVTLGGETRTIDSEQGRIGLREHLDSFSAIGMVSEVEGFGLEDAPWVLEYTSAGATLSGEITATDPSVSFVDFDETAATITQEVMRTTYRDEIYLDENFAGSDFPLSLGGYDLGRVLAVSVESDIVHNASAPDTITRTDGGSWLADGFVDGDQVRLAGDANLANHGVFLLAGVSDSVLTIATGQSLVDSDETNLAVEKVMTPVIDKLTAPSRIKEAIEELEEVFEVADVTGTGTVGDPWVIEYSSTGKELSLQLGSTSSDVVVTGPTVLFTTYRQEIWHSQEESKYTYGEKLHVRGLAGAVDDLRLAETEIQVFGTRIQELTLGGAPEAAFTLRLGGTGTPTESIEFFPNGSGGVDGHGTALDIQEVLQALLPQELIEVTFDASTNKYNVSGLDSDLLQLDDADAGVTFNAKHTQKLVIEGDSGLEFKLQLGVTGNPTGDIAIGADDSETASRLQTALSGLGSLSVTPGEIANTFFVDFGGFNDTLQLLPAVSVETTSNVNLSQDFTLAGVAGQAFRMRFGPAGAVTDEITIGNTDTLTAAAIAAVLQGLGGFNAVQVNPGATAGTYQVTALPTEQASLEAVGSETVTAISTTTQEFLLTYAPDGTAEVGPEIRLRFGEAAATTEPITVVLDTSAEMVAGTVSGADTDVNKTITLSGPEYVIANSVWEIVDANEKTLASYTVGDPSNETLQTIAESLSGQLDASPEFTASVAGEVITLTDDRTAAGPISAAVRAAQVDTTATAAAIQTGLREVLGNAVVSVAFDPAKAAYVVSGLDSTVDALELENSNFAGVTASSTSTRLIALDGQTGQQFRLKFGAGGEASSLITIDSSNAVTATRIRNALIAVTGESAVDVNFDAASNAYRIDGLAAPTGVLQRSAGAAGLTSELGAEVFKVFSVATDNANDRIEIQGSIAADNYRVSTIQAIGIEGAAEPALRYEQRQTDAAGEPLKNSTGQFISHVVVDVFDLEGQHLLDPNRPGYTPKSDYVRLNSFAGHDHI
ncbi:MAG: Ca2+-binding RTX toxin-like protein, partial [Pirellulaceae bacterium]